MKRTTKAVLTGMAVASVVWIVTNAVLNLSNHQTGGRELVSTRNSLVFTTNCYANNDESLAPWFLAAGAYFVIFPATLLSLYRPAPPNVFSPTRWVSRVTRYN